MTSEILPNNTSIWLWSSKIKIYHWLLHPLTLLLGLVISYLAVKRHSPHHLLDRQLRVG